MALTQTMRVLHYPAKGNFHIQGVQIVMLQTYFKKKKYSTNSALMQCRMLENL
jgi:hypothetical protein